MKPVRITIHHFALTSLEGDTAAFTMSVSAGGYVRSVAHELGQLAGCGAHLSSLRRTRAGAFVLEQAITIDQLKSASACGAGGAAAASAYAAAGDALGDGGRPGGRAVCAMGCR